MIRWLKKKSRNKKQNIELRFFVDPFIAKSLLKKWKEEGFKFNPYSFTDFYFKDERSNGKFAKIRKWKQPKRSVEIIFFSRNRNVKSEEHKKMKTFEQAVKHLEELGFESYLKINKKKAWLVKKKDRIYAFEFIPELGWTGEVEIPAFNKHMIKKEICELKCCGVKTFSVSSLLDTIEKKKGLKFYKKPKMYRYRFLKI